MTGPGPGSGGKGGPEAAGASGEGIRDLGVWLAISVWTAGWGWNRHDPSGISWHFFSGGVRWLFGARGLHLYADHPDLQIGPLAFLVVQALSPLPPATQRVVAQVLMTAVAPLLLVILAPLVGGTPARRRVRLLLSGLVLAPAWTVLSVRWMHLEDALALLLSVLAVRWVALAVRAGGPRWAASAGGLALGAAMAAKPWTVGFVPILLVLPVRELLPAAGTSVALAAAAWGPFLVADTATIAAFHPLLGVSDSSGLWTLGYRGTQVPAWDRTVQLILAPVAAAAVALRRRWPGVLLAAIAVRLALDPQDIGYYAAGAVLAALVFDLLATDSTLPWAGLVTAVVFWQPFVTDFPHRFTTTHGLTLWWFRHPAVVGSVHLAWSLAALLLVVRPRRDPPVARPVRRAHREPILPGPVPSDPDGL